MFRKTLHSLAPLILWFVTSAVSCAAPERADPEQKSTPWQTTERPPEIEVIDECPDLAEDVDGFEDEDGCPDPDNDRDGFLDRDDACPNEPEDFDECADEDGCPDRESPVEHDFFVAHLTPFEKGEHTLTSEHRLVLDEMAVVFGDPQHIRFQVPIRGHADPHSELRDADELSLLRATAVRDFLVEHGVNPEYLEVDALSASQPLCNIDEVRGDPARIETCKGINRRVDFGYIKGWRCQTYVY